MRELIFGEMFSGVGGFRQGLQRSGWKCVWANDWDKYANKIYKKNFGNQELVEGDIREIQAKTVPDCTLLTAGFPCQAFSVAGKRKGIKEARGTLFSHIVRVASAKRPPLLLLENVKGILSSESGRTFAIILRALAKLGYLLEWQVLNSKHFGVPQNRERVFIVGHLTGAGSKQIFPIGEASQNSAKPQKKTQGERSRFRVANPLCVGGSGRERNLIADFNQNGNVYLKAESSALRSPKASQSNLLIANTLSKRYYKDGSENLIQIGTVGKDAEATRIYDPNGIARTVKYGGGLGAKTGLYIVADRTRTLAGKGRNLESPKEETNALSSVQKDNLLFKNCRIRRLTPTECERLQGFPDDWTKGVSDTQRYKLLGNAVTVNVIEFLGLKLKECLKGEAHENSAN